MDLWMQWRWLHDTGNRYILAVYIEGFEEDDSGSDISDEDREKIDEAITEAFGASPDWENLEESGNLAEDGEAVYESTTVYKG